MESLNATGESGKPTSKIIENSTNSCKASTAKKKKKSKSKKRKSLKGNQQFVPQTAKPNQSRIHIQEKIAALRKDRVRPFVRTCVFNLQGKCMRLDCTYAHLGRPQQVERCKFFMMDSCSAGEKCFYSHNVPCKYHQVYNTCTLDNCRFSHDIMSYEERMRFLEDFKCELPPSELCHDFNQLVPKNSQNPLLRPDYTTESKDPFLKSGRPPPVLEPQVPMDTDTVKESGGDGTKNIEATVPGPDKPEPRKDKPLKPIKGFYKDTLSDDEESPESPQMPDREEPVQLVQSPNDPEAEAVKKIEEEIRMDAENLENLDPDMETFGFDASVPVGRDDPECPCINGMPDEQIEWKLQKAFAAFPDYSDLRPQYLISLSVIDPRLAPVNRKLPPKEFSEEEKARNRENDFINSLSMAALCGKGGRKKQTENDYPEDHRRISNAELAEMYAEDDTPASPVQVDSVSGEVIGEAELDLDDLDPCSGPG